MTTSGIVPQPGGSRTNRRACRQRVIDGVFVPGDADPIARIQPRYLDSATVHFNAVVAAKVLNPPFTGSKGQFAVLAGDIGKAHDDIAGFRSAYQDHRSEQWNFVATGIWQQSAVELNVFPAVEFGEYLSVS